MPRRPSPAVLAQEPMPENADILFANEAFYLAFQTKDVRAMEALWAHRQPVACTHPGWPSLSGREQVMQSWAAILANPETRGNEMRGARAYRDRKSTRRNSSH